MRVAQLALLSLAVDCVAPPAEAMTQKNSNNNNGRQDDDGIGSSDDETVSSDTTKAEGEDAEAAEDAEDEDEDDDSTASPFEADSSPNAAGRRKVRDDRMIALIVDTPLPVSDVSGYSLFYTLTNLAYSKLSKRILYVFFFKVIKVDKSAIDQLLAFDEDDDDDDEESEEDDTEVRKNAGPKEILTDGRTRCFRIRSYTYLTHT